MTSIEKGLEVRYNAALTSLSGLDNLTAIDGYLPAGLYYLELNDGQRSIVKRVIRQ
jgi:hypothetical protein